MCTPVHQRSARERRLLAIANLALAAGLGLPYVFRAAGSPGGAWLDASRGLLVGVSLGMNLLLLRWMRLCKPSSTS